jgi:hypothetical protein
MTSAPLRGRVPAASVARADGPRGSREVGVEAGPAAALRPSDATETSDDEREGEGRISCPGAACRPRNAPIRSWIQPAASRLLPQKSPLSVSITTRRIRLAGLPSGTVGGSPPPITVQVPVREVSPLCSRLWYASNPLGGGAPSDSSELNWRLPRTTTCSPVRVELQVVFAVPPGAQRSAVTGDDTPDAALYVHGCIGSLYRPRPSAQFPRA